MSAADCLMPSRPRRRSCSASEVWPPLAADLVTKRKVQKLHETHGVARVPFGSDICSEVGRSGSQMSEPEQYDRAEPGGWGKRNDVVGKTGVVNSHVLCA